MKRSLYRTRDSFAQVNFEMVGALGGDIVQAAVFDWIAWKADPSYEGVLVAGDDDGAWYPISYSDLAERMQVSPKVIRTAIGKLTASGHLEATELRRSGNGDRTRAYRPVWTEDDQLPLRATRRARDGSSDVPAGAALDVPAGAALPTTDTLGDEETDLSLIEPPQPEPTDEQLFDSFWAIWPRRVDRKDALAAFARALAKLAPRVGGRLVAAADLCSAAEQWAAVWQREAREARHIPHAATWLNHERWSDEIPAAPPARPAGEQRMSAAMRALELTQRLAEGEAHGERDRDREAIGAGRHGR